MPVADGPVTVHLSPQLRAAPDRLRELVVSQLADAGRITLATQQLSDPEVVAAVAAARRASGPARVLLESRYLREPAPVPESGLWSPAAGVNVEQRRCLAALLRAGVDVGLDNLAPLQHANIAALRGGPRPDRVLLTSANLTPGNLDKYLNWTAVIEDRDVADAVEQVLRPTLGEGFAGLSTVIPVPASGPGTASLVLGAGGQAQQAFVDLVERCEHELVLAVFAVSTGGGAVDAVLAALERGVRVEGVVDGDQGNQPWDAVPVLRERGAAVRYVPGLRTRGPGRMHLKLAVGDRTRTWLSTSNLSVAAADSLELALVHPNAPGLAGVLAAQVDRLGRIASDTPPPRGAA
jgi:hypothetical protein